MKDSFNSLYNTFFDKSGKKGIEDIKKTKIRLTKFQQNQKLNYMKTFREFTKYEHSMEQYDVLHYLMFSDYTAINRKLNALHYKFFNEKTTKISDLENRRITWMKT